MDAIGGETVLTRFQQDLEDAFLDEYEGDGGNALEALGVMSQLIRHSKMRILVQERETFRHIVEYLKRRIRSGEKHEAEELAAKWTEWEMALFYFECVSRGLCETRNLILNGNGQIRD